MSISEVRVKTWEDGFVTESTSCCAFQLLSPFIATDLIGSTDCYRFTKLPLHNTWWQMLSRRRQQRRNKIKKIKKTGKTKWDKKLNINRAGVVSVCLPSPCTAMVDKWRERTILKEDIETIEQHHLLPSVHPTITESTHPHPACFRALNT